MSRLAGGFFVNVLSVVLYGLIRVISRLMNTTLISQRVGGDDEREDAEIRPH